jgi:hypothetical protein
MSDLELWVAGAGLVTSLVAAIFWLWASLTKIPPFPDVGLDSDSSVFESLHIALRRASRRNAVAALFSGLTAVSSALLFARYMGFF